MRRNLLAIELQNEPFTENRINEAKGSARKLLDLSSETVKYYVFTGTVSNLAYAPDSPEIKILTKSGGTVDMKTVSDMFDHHFLSERIIKHFLCYPKETRK